jgi:dinuclear metal center YbgI/SA1388 family protein
MSRVLDVFRAVDRAAPFALQLGNDNSGLLLGDRGATVRRVLVALDPTLAAAREARRRRADVLVTHHPIFFDPQRRVTADTYDGAVALELLRSHVALIAAHTNYDAARGGLNDLLAVRLGLVNIAPLDPSAPERSYKLVTFVPEADLKRVQAALFAAGAGHIGDYSECSFHSSGTGTFLGGATTRPTVGRRGRREQAPELRLETVVPSDRVDAAVRALRAAHSYEEPAYDLVPVEVRRDGAGIGRLGTLPRAMTMAEVITLAKRAFKVRAVELVGRPAGRRVRRVAVGSGACGFVWPKARAAGADVLLIGEMKHSDRLAAAENGMPTILAGHWATERPAVAGLAKIVAAALPDVRVMQTATERDPSAWR